MSFLREALHAGKEKLRKASIDEPELSAELLLAKLLSISRSQLLLLDPKRKLSTEQIQEFDRLLTKRLLHWPVAYLLGEQEFFGLSFEVNPAVLIPRPETELLVESGLKLMRGLPGNPWIADLGTGSGCIAVTMAKENPKLFVLAVDRSRDAIAVAKRNAIRHGVEKRIHFCVGDFLQATAEQRFFDLVISNPPYINAAEKNAISISVKDFEPSLALFTPPGDPLICYKEIAQQASTRLKPGAWLICEMGLGQSQALAQEMNARKFKAVQTRPDFAGIERVLLAQQPL